MTAQATDLIEHEQRMLHEMVGCAHAFGMAFGAEARAATDDRQRLEAYDRFERCFLAVRMGVRLRLRLAATPRAAAVERETEDAEREETRLERPDRERDDGAEREREREYEPVSLPAFLKTLGVIQSDAANLGDRLPAKLRTETLPALQGLLSKAAPQTATRSHLAATAAPVAFARETPRVFPTASRTVPPPRRRPP